MTQQFGRKVRLVSSFLITALTMLIVFPSVDTLVRLLQSRTELAGSFEESSSLQSPGAPTNSRVHASWCCACLVLFCPGRSVLIVSQTRLCFPAVVQLCCRHPSILELGTLVSTELPFVVQSFHPPHLHLPKSPFEAVFLFV